MAVMATVLVVAGIVGVGSYSLMASPSSANAGSGSTAAGSVRGPGNRLESLGGHAVNLPRATTAPVAAPAALVNAAPLANRENFAFAPYWTLPNSGTFSLTGLSTLAYFSIGVNANGTLDQTGPGWNGYESQALSDLVTRAHAAGERVVLTVNDFDQGSLDSLTSSANAASTLASALIPAIRAKSLDGVNFDFEGEGSGDQAGLTNLIAAVSGTLRATDPHWQITMDTYASSAGDPAGFYNIPALAPYVDAFFVMDYGLNLQGASSASSPLTSSMFSDLSTLEQYTAVVPAGKVILGKGFFGIDWPTTNGTMAATATGPGTDIADSEVQTNSTDPSYWDPVTATGWTSYQVGTQWHEAYLESPYGLYQLSQLASHYGVRGLGIWALGMEANDAQMITAMDGFAPAQGPGSAGPNSTSTSPATPATPGAPPVTATATGPAGTGSSGSPAGTTPATAGSAPSTPATSPAAPTTTTAPPWPTGIFNGKTVQLQPVGPGSVDVPVSWGTITSFATTNPAYACLVGETLQVYSYGNATGDDVAVAAKAGSNHNCIDQDFTFPAPA
jgi:spore germination protein